MSDPAADASTTMCFHEGELAVQRRAGVLDETARLSGMLAPARLGYGVSRFLAERTFAAITTRDAAGTLWTSPLVGPPGFLRVAAPTVLEVAALPAEGDPLRHLLTPQAAGLIVIEFALRRRLRLNGTLAHAGRDGLRIDVREAFGNCPQYIQARILHKAPAPLRDAGPVRHGLALTEEDAALIRRSDTFFIGTTHPGRGADCSHRGGPPGFVRVEHGRLWWPDYRGNNMFNTLGNLALDPAAALLFPDFAAGRTLQLSGRAAVRWTSPGSPGDDGDTGRRVEFTPQRLTAATRLPLRAGSVVAAPDNPQMANRRFR